MSCFAYVLLVVSAALAIDCVDLENKEAVRKQVNFLIQTGKVLSDSHQYKRAETKFKEAYSTCRATFSENSFLTAKCLDYMGRNKFDQGELNEAREYFSEKR